MLTEKSQLSQLILQSMNYFRKLGFTGQKLQLSSIDSSLSVKQASSQSPFTDRDTYVATSQSLTLVNEPGYTTITTPNEIPIIIAFSAFPWYHFRRRFLVQRFES
jgi:hypothetical protein